MKRIFLLVVLLGFAASGLAGAAPPRLMAKKPNIVFILTDDQGYGDPQACNLLSVALAQLLPISSACPNDRGASISARGLTLMPQTLAVFV